MAEPAPVPREWRAAGGDAMLIVSPLPGLHGLRLDGEVDLSNQHQLRQALDALAASTGVIHLELAGLRFIDVAGTRQLAQLTLRNPQARLILHHALPTLRFVIKLFWPYCNIEIRD